MKRVDRSRPPSASPRSRLSSEASAQASDGPKSPRRQGISITVGVNGSGSGWQALDWAAAEASAHGRQLHIVHVAGRQVALDPSSAALGLYSVVPIPMERGHQVLEDAVQRARRIAPDVDLTTSLRVGDVVGRLTEADEDASLLVVGRPERRTGVASLRRSITRRIIRRSHLPVTVVALAQDPEHGPSAGRVVIAMNDDRTAATVLQLGISAAASRGLGVTIVHPVDRRPTLDALVSRAEMLSPRTEMRLLAVSGSLTDTIVSESRGAALAVLASAHDRRVRMPWATASERVPSLVRVPTMVISR
ncbi:universal stress protein [Humibacillus xanthopallidus]|uniref:Universal stress protein family protein n=1 Tax=Humibacillus xanthopallidus TaxID=412689 RepID=A0A543I292_9MICO|nr:universal stress protein [Humibacillus xanthopallidus]TQM64705.1 universal stress protein family protein [Humibacillus xanthopallidus]